MRSKNALFVMTLTVCAFVLISSCDLAGGSDDDSGTESYAWSALGSGVGVNGDWTDFVSALALDSSHNLYVGGSFNTVGGISTSTVAKWNGSAWSALSGGNCPTGND